MTDGELRTVERELGRIAGVLDSVVREIGILRKEIPQVIADHDKRDDERFAANGREHDAMNRTLATLQQRDAQEEVSAGRWHNWQIGLLGVVGVIAAALLSAVATAHLTTGLHP